MRRPAADCFESPDYLSALERYRILPATAMKAYLRKMEQCLTSPRSRILDLGAGTGRFSAAILRDEAFKDIELIAIDESESMTRHLEQYVGGDERVQIFRASATDFEDAEGFDLIWCSEMVHLVEEILPFASAVGRLLRPGGAILIRTSSQSQLSTRDWYRDFPEARVVDLERHPSVECVEAAISLVGLSTSTETIDESREVSPDWYFQALGSQSFSTLRIIPESSWRLGLELAKKRFRDSPSLRFDYEMTLIQGLAAI
jgi:SAM-dependent methyltransferase